jgi:hypothetical protein
VGGGQPDRLEQMHKIKQKKKEEQQGLPQLNVTEQGT